MRRAIVPLLLVLLLTIPSVVPAQTSEPPPPASPPEGAPAEVAPAPEAAPMPAPVHHKKRIRKRRRHHAGTPEVETTVEPANARLKVKSSGAPIYARGSKRSEQLGTLNADKYVQVTGSTRSYLQIQLKDGRTGFIDPSSVELVTPFDKDFLLTADSPVYAVPNQFSQKVAEVHRGKYVHVIGHALSYVQIRMKDGTEGFVPMTAVQ